MDAEITTERVGMKWHAYLDGRPEIDETGLTEEAARRKVRELRDRFGVCGAKTGLFGGRTCERVRGHHALLGRGSEHRSGGRTWIDAGERAAHEVRARARHHHRSTLRVRF
jgi:hypothetical protein